MNNIVEFYQRVAVGFSYTALYYFLFNTQKTTKGDYLFVRLPQNFFNIGPFSLISLTLYIRQSNTLLISAFFRNKHF